jgi:hypothetical protein
MWLHQILAEISDRTESPSIDTVPSLAYCRATSMGIMPVPHATEDNAFPRTAPKHLIGSSAFIAWPGTDEVVNKSPTSMGDALASTLQ